MRIYRIQRKRLELARPRLRPTRGIRQFDSARRGAAGFSGLANGGTECLLRGGTPGVTPAEPREAGRWRRCTTNPRKDAPHLQRAAAYVNAYVAIAELQRTGRVVAP